MSQCLSDEWNTVLTFAMENGYWLRYELNPPVHPLHMEVLLTVGDSHADVSWYTLVKPAEYCDRIMREAKDRVQFVKDQRKIWDKKK